MKVINLGIGVLSGVAVYAVVMYFMKVDEYTMLLGLIKSGVNKKLKRNR